MILPVITMWLGGAACAAANRLQLLNYVPPRTWQGWLDLTLRAAFWQADFVTVVRRTVAKSVEARSKGSNIAVRVEPTDDLEQRLSLLMPVLSSIRQARTTPAEDKPPAEPSESEISAWVTDGGPDLDADMNAAETTEPPPAYQVSESFRAGTLKPAA